VYKVLESSPEWWVVREYPQIKAFIEIGEGAIWKWLFTHFSFVFEH
jgi:hypothetical protein